MRRNFLYARKREINLLVLVIDRAVSSILPSHTIYILYTPRSDVSMCTFNHRAKMLTTRIHSNIELYHLLPKNIRVNHMKVIRAFPAIQQCHSTFWACEQIPFLSNTASINRAIIETCMAM